ncbi:hypothetical protein [Mycobacterium riyadhense]|uniref:hypothetical protein n=1 Tax=Mycobacterium riyadhense TaxID=486698 RepID=UPI001EF9E04E|nr:hypothetical protein [Mycobacterium riyadhense]
MIGEHNSTTHAAAYEGRPERRPLTRTELQAFFRRRRRLGGTGELLAAQGQLAAFRDATLFKVIYAWGLRRREAAMLDVNDFAVNPGRAG